VETLPPVAWVRLETTRKLGSASNQRFGCFPTMSTDNSLPHHATVTSASNLATQESEEVITAAEVGKILRLHPVTVRLQAAAGIIPGRQIGNRWRFSRTRINEWLRDAA
jgi:excisionase family DNA binding protein